MENYQPRNYEEFINRVPWEKNPMVRTKENMAAYYAAVKLLMGDRPVTESIDYYSIIWDFNKVAGREKKDPGNMIYYADCPRDIYDYARFFTIHKLEMKKKPSTISVRVSNFESILQAVINKTNHKSLGVICTDDLIAEVQSRDVSFSHVHAMYESLYQFYYYLEENCGMSLPVNLNTLKELGKAARRQDKAHIEENKWPNIPKEYYDRIFTVACKVMRNHKSAPQDKIMAASIILLSQLGVRIGDLLNFRVDSMYEEDAEGLTMHYINYFVEKLCKPHAPQVRFDIYVSPVAYEAYNIILEARTLLPRYSSFDNLILFAKKSRWGYMETYAPLKSAFRTRYKEFFATYLPSECHYAWNGIRKTVIRRYDMSAKEQYLDNVYVPATPQYRVRLCTFLYEHGVKLSYIEEHLAHLSEAMYGYYARPKDTRQENTEQAEKFIASIVLEDMTPIGLHGEQIKANLQRFIEGKNANVKTDVKAILAEIDDEVAIRAKTGGFCFRSSSLACPDDPHTKKLLCAFNHCPNVYTFYDMADVSYSKFKACQEAYYANISRGLTNAATKELNNAKDIINRALGPQLFQLDKELTRQGADAIIARHPTMEPIINRLEEIKQEVNIWKKK